MGMTTMITDRTKLVPRSQEPDPLLKEKAAIVDGARDAMIVITPLGVVCTWNAGAAYIFGYSAEYAVGETISVLIEPRDADEQRIILSEVCDNNPAGPIEVRCRREDGKIVTIELLLQPIVADGGQVTALAAYMRDVSARKRSDKLRALVVDELNHRINNTIATVGAIAAQSLHSATSLDAFGAAFGARLHSLSTTHNILARGAWRGTTLVKLIEAEFAPYENNKASRWKMTGVDILLDSDRAVAISMMLHELATNALKHGALSVPDGWVDISWHTPTTGDAMRLNLTWAENGGPTVATPIRKGMGTWLLTDGLAAQLDGKVLLNFECTGVRCTIDVPIDAGKLPA